MKKLISDEEIYLTKEEQAHIPDFHLWAFGLEFPTNGINYDYPKLWNQKHSDIEVWPSDWATDEKKMMIDMRMALNKMVRRYIRGEFNGR